ncbi:probable inactive leucine-rich repeat receptor kinase XIAO [Humulus lupulus]|uniref:probable inactive leucine-rich repeat receptor kinase XIAO n=1 Tax=Humulus lupulus TaxID=3486 RepID=UPI002B414C90|nr:probable inactive leucine-rich repeat receptor kinase XIAO [Humulus lupulus]
MGACNFFGNLILVITVTGLLLGGESKTDWGDITVLKELKNGLDPNSVSPGSCVSSWDFTVDPCDNLFSERFTCGFRCDFTDDSGTSRVTELSLDQAGYSGSLTSISWNLPYLQILDLSNNFFSGSIPNSLSNLTRLQQLGLSTNSFSGEIPTSIGGSLPNLEELSLDNNQLQGKIPASFNGLVSLKRLEIQSNNLSGEFPDLGSLKNLYFLDASNNAIPGRVPANLPSSLVEISLRNNSLEGTIPQDIKKLGFLQVMDLSHNRLSGSVPSILFNHPSLQQLTLSFNQFSSVQSPNTHGATILSELIALDLNDNQLQGFLPSFMALMPKLSALSLENNKFSGMIPTQYAIKTALPETGVSPFERLLLGGNYLFGPIPGPLMQLKPGSANVELTGNCLLRCPDLFFFCQGDDQKSLMECKAFSPTIP